MLKGTHREGRQSLWGFPRPEITWVEESARDPNRRESLCFLSSTDRSPVVPLQPHLGEEADGKGGLCGSGSKLRMSTNVNGQPFSKVKQVLEIEIAF